MTRTALSMFFVSALAALVACGTNTSQSQQGSQSTGQGGDDDSGGGGGGGGIAGGNATSNESSSDGLGSSYEGVTCDDQSEGTAWCDDDYNIVYCDGGTWHDFDCAYIGDVCVQFDDGTVDCYDDFD